MVSPATRREWVRWVIGAYRLSERRASRATGASLSSFWYKSVRSSDLPLRQRLRELAQVRVSYGYQRLHVLLCREGWSVNRKKVLRLYREEGNGTEFTSRSLDHWAYWNKVRLDFSRPGKPTDNSFIESFNSSLRRECLSQHYFIDREDAQRTLDL